MEASHSDIFVVVRSVGERTEDACLQIVRSQLSTQDQLVLIKNKPFPEAHVESVQYALESKAPWALFLDADILLKPEAIGVMIAEAKKIAFPFYQYNFRILDYGFNGESYGVHFYSTRYFEQALQFKDICLQAQRPEYQMCFEIANTNKIPSISSNVVVGLHGFQQYYTDMYRTAFVRAIKYKRHQSYMLRLYQDMYFREDGRAQDFRFMFWGLVDGTVYSYDHDRVSLDRLFFEKKTDRVFSLVGAQEKDKYSLEPGYVERVFENYSPDELYISNRHWICPSSFFAVPVPDQSFGTRMQKYVHAFLARVKKSIYALLYG